VAERPELWVARLPGLVPYAEGVAIQERVRERRQAGEIPDALLLLEHPPVFTRGRRTEAADLPFAGDWYREQGIDVQDTERGGRVTYHGPGQLVGYPIMQIDGVAEFVHTMERAIIAALADEGIEAGPRDGLTGVWAGDAKIASIGIHVSRGVTMHGFAVNVENDLTPFEWVVACGIGDVQMTSVRERGGEGIDCFRKRMAWRFAEAYGRRQRVVTLERLLGEPAQAGASLESVTA
jgi:lipoyl(octanoyl) transferase